MVGYEEVARVEVETLNVSRLRLGMQGVMTRELLPLPLTPLDATIAPRATPHIEVAKLLDAHPEHLDLPVQRASWRVMRSDHGSARTGGLSYS